MRLGLCFLLIIFYTFELEASLLDRKKSSLKENQRIQKQLNKKLEDLAEDIINGQKSLKKLSIQIAKINKKSEDTKDQAKRNAKELKLLSQQNVLLLKDKNNMEGKLVNLIAKDFAYDLALRGDDFINIDSIIVSEVIKHLDIILKDEFYRLSKQYAQINKLIEKKEIKISSLNKGLKNYEEQLLKLQKLRKIQEKELKIQKTNKSIYAKKIDNLEKQQIQLRQTLAKLQIIKEEKRKKIYTKNSKTPRLIGGGYGSSAVIAYKGKPTIAPLDSFSVKQSFGQFTDPIYKIKIFNENVILRSNEENAPVKSVLAGKVVFAKDTPILQNVVIVEHADGIHTIYAHLERIAPTIKAGRNIRKGYIIGRVKRDLTFEVTQKNYHINPMQLIH